MPIGVQQIGQTPQENLLQQLGRATPLQGSDFVQRAGGGIVISNVISTPDSPAIANRTANRSTAIRRTASITSSVRSQKPNPLTPSYAFEQVAAILTPFDLQGSYRSFVGSAGTRTGRNRSFALNPIVQTGGLVFPYNPTISEGTGIKYDVMELTHRNESYYAYRGTDNVRITLRQCTWTADTFSNAIYVLAVIHFLRTYRLMDFGYGRTGRPPSPMWFRAYGNYAFYRKPVLMEKASWTWPNDIDYVGVPEPGTQEYSRGQLALSKSSRGKYTWLPVKFTAEISLIVQHSPSYWINWNLDDYRRGAMLRNNNSFDYTRVRSSGLRVTPPSRSTRVATGNPPQV